MSSDLFFLPLSRFYLTYLLIYYIILYTHTLKI